VSAPLERAVAAGVRSFQRLFTQLQVSELALAPHERAALLDWDRPEDMEG
jgi:hypothetical protein